MTDAIEAPSSIDTISMSMTLTSAESAIFLVEEMLLQGQDISTAGPSALCGGADRMAIAVGAWSEYASSMGRLARRIRTRNVLYAVGVVLLIASAILLIMRLIWNVEFG